MSKSKSNKSKSPSKDRPILELIGIFQKAMVKLVFDAEDPTHWNGPLHQVSPRMFWLRGDRAAVGFKDWLAWNHKVSQVICAVTQSAHTHLMYDYDGPVPRWEFWVYQADGTSKLVAMGIGEFDKRWIKRAIPKLN
jgi:hypothetical protein